MTNPTDLRILDDFPREERIKKKNLLIIPGSANVTDWGDAINLLIEHLNNSNIEFKCLNCGEVLKKLGQVCGKCNA